MTVWILIAIAGAAVLFSFLIGFVLGIATLRTIDFHEEERDAA